MTLQQIKDSQLLIESCVSKSIEINNPSSVMEKLEEISRLLSTGASCIAYSKNLLLKARKTALDSIYLAKDRDKELQKALSASVVKQFIETRTIDEETLYAICDRNYSSLVHSGDFLRSILSTIKEEMRISSNV